MSSEWNWWWVELFFQIYKKKKNQTIFNTFKQSYSTANILIVFLHLHCTGTFYSQNTLKTGWLISICYTLWNILNKLENQLKRNVTLVVEILEKAK